MGASPSALAWIEKAEEDAKLARLAESASIVEYASTIAYHCQQCAEKYLKAFLVEQTTNFPKTHDFGTLIELCEPYDARFADLIAVGDRLQPFAVEVRYPYTTPNEAEVRQALEDMERFRAFCRALL